jgi:hypothetical protein
MSEQWSLCAPLLQRLPQPFKYMPSALGECIEAEDTVVGQGHLTRPRHLATPDQPHSGDGMMGGAKRPGGVEGLRQRDGRQNGGRAAGPS